MTSATAPGARGAEALGPAPGRGWLAGFGNMLDKELGSWWRTRRWIVHIVLWPALVVFFGLMEWLSSRDRATPAAALADSAGMFFQLGGFFTLLGAVLVTQGAIVGERRVGTAAWVLTKPVTRSAFILSKFVGITFSFLVLAVVVPSLVWLVQMQLQWGLTPALTHFGEALALLALHHAFYVAFTLVLGTFFQHRGGVSGTALGFWIAGNILPNLVSPKWIAWTPWPLAQLGGNVAMWQPVPLPLWQPALATALLLMLCLGVALAKFEREEF